MKTTTLRWLRFVLFALVFILSFAALSSTETLGSAITKTGHEIDYFSDATFTHQVGFVIFCRNGQTFRSGQMTRFSKIMPSGC
jgi:hypothetical protein